MEVKTHVPSFTVSLRGYDREEVDEYLDSLAEALSQVQEAEQHTRRLQSHVARCNARIKELEDRIRTDTPKSGAALGERIGVLLHEAEETAAEIVAKAEANAARIVSAAEQRALETDERIRNSTALAEEQAHRIESVARGEAAEIVSEAEARATARTRQIEQWAEQVVSHTRAEEARMLAEHRRTKAAKDAELASLEEQRLSAVGMLAELHDLLGRATGMIAEPFTTPAEPEPSGPAATVVDDAPADPVLIEAAAAQAAIPMAPIAVDEVDAAEEDEDENEVADADADRTGEFEVITVDERPVNNGTSRLAYDLYGPDRTDNAEEEPLGIDPPLGDDEFETKLETWVSGGGR
jgi:DivIVA domain-containing protein